jgi:hypothetical protein
MVLSDPKGTISSVEFAEKVGPLDSEPIQKITGRLITVFPTSAHLMIIWGKTTVMHVYGIGHGFDENPEFTSIGIRTYSLRFELKAVC